MTQGLQFLEKNSNRMRLYFYKFRNQLFLAKNGYWEKHFLYCAFLHQKAYYFLKLYYILSLNMLKFY